MIRLLLAVVIVSSSLVDLQCRSSRKSSRSGAQAVAAVPPDFEVMFGEGGGFTGRWKGYTVRADGALNAWSGSMAGENERSAGQLTMGQLNALWHHIEQAAFFANETHEYGNMTATIAVTADGKQHRVSWPPRVRGFEPPETALDSLYFYFWDIAEEMHKD